MNLRTLLALLRKELTIMRHDPLVHDSELLAQKG